MTVYLPAYYLRASGSFKRLLVEGNKDHFAPSKTPSRVAQHLSLVVRTLYLGYATWALQKSNHRRRRRRETVADLAFENESSKVGIHSV